MKRTVFLLTVLGVCALLLAACANENPYRQYTRAYEQLLAADSFVLTRSATDYTFHARSGDEQDIIRSGTCRVVNTGDEYQAIFHSTWQDSFRGEESATNILVTDIFYRDGNRYVENTAGTGSKHRTRCDDDSAMRSATIDIIQFPEDVIAEQSAQKILDGQMLTFVLDSEKYFAYRYPENESGSTPYFDAYREPPLYTVLLDADGRIKEINGNFCEIRTEDDDTVAFVYERSYYITFTQYGDVELNFPELNDEDFLDIDALREQAPIEEGAD